MRASFWEYTKFAFTGKLLKTQQVNGLAEWLLCWKNITWEDSILVKTDAPCKLGHPLRVLYPVCAPLACFLCSLIPFLPIPSLSISMTPFLPPSILSTILPPFLFPPPSPFFLLTPSYFLPLSLLLCHSFPPFLSLFLSLHPTLPSCFPVLPTFLPLFSPPLSSPPNPGRFNLPLSCSQSQYPCGFCRAYCIDSVQLGVKLNVVLTRVQWQEANLPYKDSQMETYRWSKK